MLRNSGVGRTDGACAFAFVLDGARAGFAVLPHEMGAESNLATFLFAFDVLRFALLALLCNLIKFFGCLRHGVIAAAGLLLLGSCVNRPSGFRARRFATELCAVIFSSRQSCGGVVATGALLERRSADRAKVAAIVTLSCNLLQATTCLCCNSTCTYM